MIHLQATNDLQKVSLWLGHAGMQTTQMYVDADPDEKLEVMEQAIPRGSSADALLPQTSSSTCFEGGNNVECGLRKGIDARVCRSDFT
jgi:hypothetical protein